jgi:hypothetical protein
MKGLIVIDTSAPYKYFSRYDFYEEFVDGKTYQKEPFSNDYGKGMKTYIWTTYKVTLMYGDPRDYSIFMVAEEAKSN